MPLEATGNQNAFNFLLGAGISLGRDTWLSLRYTASTFTDNQSRIFSYATEEGFDITISSFSLGLQFYMTPSSLWSPYLMVGPGIATIESVAFFGPTTNTTEIISFGAGMDFTVASSAHIFVEAEFATASSGAYNFAPIRMGFRYTP